MSDVFTKPNDMYKQNMSPVKSYVDQATVYISRTQNINKDDARKLIVDHIKKSNAVDPIVKYNERQDNSDKKVTTSTLTNYLKTAIINEEIIVPSFTCYTNPKVKDSIHKNFVLDNLSERSKEKKLAAKYEMEGDLSKHRFHDVMQKTKKIFNNSLSGAYASKSTILYNPSAHYTLTSITRSVASIGNSVTEMMVAGNRHYATPDTVINHFSALLSGIDRDAVEKTIRKYKLKIPTVKNVMDLVLRSITFYWSSADEEKNILNYIESMSDLDRVIVTYANDLYQLRIHNDELVRELIKGLGEKTIFTKDPDIDILKKSNGDVLNLMHHVCSEELRGKKTDYELFKGTPVLETLIATTEKINSTLEYYEDLIQSLFSTDIMPIDIVDIKKMTRRAIVLSDTDSTVGSYAEWVEWYLGELMFSDKATGIAAAVMSLTAGTLGHYLKVLSANMNVPIAQRDMLAMKNEFYWDVFIAANVSKHYFANTCIKEGAVFGKSKLEVKGAHLVVSKLPKRYKDMTTYMEEEIIKTITSNKKIDLAYWIKFVADIEREVLDLVKKGSLDVLKLDSIKEEDAYKLDRTRSPFWNHLFWNKSFGIKYGEADKPPYAVVKVSTKLNTANKLKTFVSGIKDDALRVGMEEFLKVMPKGALSTVRIPHTIALKNGIPDELYDILDKEKMVMSITAPFYIILETLDFYKKDNLLLLDLGY